MCVKADIFDDISQITDIYFVCLASTQSNYTHCMSIELWLQCFGREHFSLSLDDLLSGKFNTRCVLSTMFE